MTYPMPSQGHLQVHYGTIPIWHYFGIATLLPTELMRSPMFPSRRWLDCRVLTSAAEMSPYDAEDKKRHHACGVPETFRSWTCQQRRAAAHSASARSRSVSASRSWDRGRPVST